MSSNAEAKKRNNWFGTMLSYAKGSGGRLAVSVIFSMISLCAGLVPFFCVYRILDLYISGMLDGTGITKRGCICLR